MKTPRALALAILCWALVACGGSGGDTALNNGGGVGTGGTGITLGTVTGFGSVLVDGTAYNSASPQYFAQSSQSEAALASPSDVQLGSQVQVALDAQGNPSSVTVAPELVGAASNPDATGFSVNGVRVRINNLLAAGPRTYFAGLAGPAAVRSGMQLAVSGTYAVDSSDTPFVQATLVERLPDSNAITRVSGLVTGLAAHSFQLGTMDVVYSAATQVTPATPALANGLYVTAWSNQSLKNGGLTLLANSIRVRSLIGRSGPVQISGLVSHLAGTGFQVSAIAIDASASALSAVLASLVNGQYVTVQGQVDSDSGRILASAIASFASQPVPTRIQGTITGYLASNAFFVRGVPVDASAAGVLSSAAAAALADGVYVDLTGTVGTANAAVVVVTSLNVVNQPATGKTVVYRGTVSQLTSARNAFVLNRQQDGSNVSESIALAANVSYSNGTALQLANGASVELETTKLAAGLTAYSIKFIAAAPPPNGAGGSPPDILIHGRVEDLGSSSMRVGGISVQLNGVAPQGGTLGNGDKVDVWLRLVNGNCVAQSITLID
jgi:hypothetical protein